MSKTKKWQPKKKGKVKPFKTKSKRTAFDKAWDKYYGKDAPKPSLSF